MKLRIIEPGKADAIVDIDGDKAVVGRAPECDVVVQHPYVSRRHAEIRRGVFIFDLESRAGTFVGGKRVTMPTAVADQSVQLGTEVRVEVIESVPSTGTEASDLLLLRSERDDLRAKVSDLEHEVRRLKDLDASRRRSSAPTSGSFNVGPGPSRVGSAPAPESDISPELLNALTGKSPAGSPAEFEPKPALPASDPAGLAPVSAPGPTAPEPPVDDFAQQLRKAMEANRGNRELPDFKQPVPASPPPLIGKSPLPPPTAKAPPVAPPPSRDPAAPPHRVGTGSPRPSVNPPSAPDWLTSDLLVRIVQSDLQRGESPFSSAGPELYLFAESVTFLRRVEKVVTAAAGDLRNQLNPGTILPGAARSFRQLVTDLAIEDTPGTRAEIADYFDQLRRWLWVSLQASPAAAKAFTDELRAKLSEEGLTRDDPIGGFGNVFGRKEAELWRRATETLQAYTPGVLEDRLDALRRDEAEKLLDRVKESTDS
jgi:hypothetical protein